MHFLVHWRIWQKSKKCRRGARKAILLSIVDELFEQRNIFLTIHYHQALFPDFLEVVLGSFMHHLIEELPVVFFDKILFDVSKDVKTIEKMIPIKLSFCPHNLQSCRKSRIFVRSDDIWKLSHDVRKCLQYLHVSLLCLLIADNKTERNQLFWST